MGKQSCFHEQKLRKGLWSPEEDEKLLKHIAKHGHTCWSSVPKLAGLQRCGKSCRLRWINYLRPDLKRGTFSEQEESLIVKLHAVLGNRWSQIAAQLPGRTDNEIKNLWNSCIKKKLRHNGIDPNTHKPLLSGNQGVAEDDKTSSGSSQNLNPAEPELTATSSNHLLWLNYRNGEFGMNPEISACASLSYSPQSHLPDDHESIYWPEYLQGNFPVPSLLHFQIQPSQAAEINKAESNFDMESFELCFQNQQPELQQRISSLFGHI